ncbi:nucleotide exchange factor GrpE [soil metagenome]
MNDDYTEIEAIEGASGEVADEGDLIAILKERSEALMAERDDLRNDLLRAQAEFANSRRRIEQKAKDDQKFATQRVVADLIPVLDNFERTVRYFETGATAEQMVEGVRAVEKQLFMVLEKQGVARIAAQGEHFDPDRHEAIAMAESDEESGTVIEVLETGYTLADRVVRPARVKVAA